jgi:cytochrome c553
MMGNMMVGMSAIRWWAAVAATAAAAQTVEFNRSIRPILSDRCFTCHGPDAANRKTALRLDTESGARAAIVPGDPDKSELVRRIASADKSRRMPPAYMGHDPLPTRDIAALREWVRQGAKWEPHWSLIPPRRDPGATIDSLVRARLARQGMALSPEADKRTLARRVTLDLTGLPPTPSEVDAFVADDSVGAYQRLVDRLLDSSRYGERMAIRWLEAARYADTNGYQSDGVRTMWPWRDWVVAAFRRNMPFNQFTVEQIAGDLLPGATLEQRIATAFHRNHRTSAEGGIVDEEFRVEYVADRAETTATVWLGMTMGCARCHDHKYDPITQRDFYRLFAFFNSVPEKGFVYNFGNEPPFIAAPDPPQRRRLAELDTVLATARDRWQSLQPAVDAARAQWVPPSAWAPSEGLVLDHRLDDPAFDGKRVVDLGDEKGKFNHRDPLTLAVRVNAASPKGAILTRAEDYWEGTGYGLYLVDGRLRFHFVFRWTDLGMRVETRDPLPLNQWHDVAVTYDGSMLAAGAHIYVDGREWPLKVLFDQHLWPISHKAPLRVGAGGGLGFEGRVSSARVYSRALSSDEVAAIAGSGQAIARLAFLESHLPPELADARKAMLDAQAARDKFHQSLPTVMVMEDRADPRDTFVLRRGAYDAPGEKVAAAVPAVLGQLPAGAKPNRLALARWLVSRDNPLTARVTVNRFWQTLFGSGLVRTVEDFGSQGEWPVHQDVLDWLAVDFLESGWDVKRLIKTIVTSDVYRQSSRVTPDLLARDPENRLLARAPRLRLSAEMIRDQALAISGLLVDRVGGPPVKPYQPPGLWQELAGGSGYSAGKGDDLYRRSLYTYWRRTIAPPAMVTFDSPTRETCIVRESRTNTPLQALNLMNDTTFVEAARKFAERIVRDGGATADERIGHAFRLALGRGPRPEELAVLSATLARFSSRYAADPKAAEQLLGQGESPRDAALAPAEVAAYTGLASLVLNLDETVTKE